MSQGLLDFGADFQADLERAAEWVARSIRAIDETIRVLKDGLKQSGKKKDVAQRIGVNTEVDAEETLKDLQVLRKQYEMIGNYPELVHKAEYWDGESEVDPVGDYLEHARRERLEAEAEGEMSADGFSVDAHYAAVSRIEKLFENAVYCGEYPDLKHGEATVHIHRFACPMMIGGEKTVAWLTAKQTTNVEGSERLYNLELVDIEKLAGTLEYLASHRLDTALPSASTDILAQIDDAFKTYFEDAVRYWNPHRFPQKFEERKRL